MPTEHASLEPTSKKEIIRRLRALNAPTFSSRASPRALAALLAWKEGRELTVEGFGALDVAGMRAVLGTLGVSKGLRRKANKARLIELFRARDEEPATKTSVEPVREAEATSDSASVTESESAAETESAADSESGSAAEAESESASASASESESESESDSETEAESESEAEAAAKSETEAAARSEIETEAAAKSEIETEAAAKSETEIPSEAESAVDPSLRLCVFARNSSFDSEADSNAEAEAEAEAETEAPADGLERRATPRVALDVDIGYRSETNFYTGFSEDLSEGGLFIATVELLPVGQPVEVFFVLPEGDAIYADGTVTWIRQGRSFDSELTSGMGIAFDGLDEVHEEAIRRYMRRRPPLFYVD